MEKYFKRKSTLEPQEVNEVETTPTPTHQKSGPSLKKRFIEVDLENLPADPGERKQMSCYHPNHRDEIRRVYLAKGPCQPKKHNFPQRQFGTFLRRFNPDWFLEFGSWLEYSVSKDATFCLCCYLMRFEIGENNGWDAFITDGFSNWKKKDRLNVHVGRPNSAHNQAWRKCNALMNQKQHIEVAINKQSDLVKRDYRIHLTGTVECIRLLLRLGLAFRADDESEDSKNKGNFLYIVQFLEKNNEEFGKVLKRCRGNLKLVAPSIQKDIVKAVAFKTTKAILDDLKDDFFSILIDESRDISVKEQMAVVLRYVDKKGHVIERFLGVVHVPNTSAISLKIKLESLLAKYNLSLSRVRGQGYDGASKMRGEYNGLKSLIIKENKCAFYVHCFAHQLQLALVAVAKKLDDIAWFFMMVNNLSNVVGASCKRRDMLRESQTVKVVEALESGDISSGRGKNQESTVTKAGDTRWGSHYGTLLRLTSLFPSVCDVLNMIVEDSLNSDQRVEARLLLNTLPSFEFIFKLFLMRNIMGITNDLSQALQRKDQDVVNAMLLVKVSKDRLQKMKEDGWHGFLSEVSLFCEKQNVDILNMDDAFVLPGKPRRNLEKVSNLHHFQVEVFYQVIDRQLQELNNRFSEVSSELLICVACLNPRDLRLEETMVGMHLLQMARFYPFEFSSLELLGIDDQLENYIMDVRSCEQFSNLDGISDLSRMLVKTRKHIAYPMVYLLLKLALLLHVATATVERSFSAMSFVKNQMRNRMGDEFLNHCLVTYIEGDIFDSVENEKILQHFQNMKPRREQL